MKFENRIECRKNGDGYLMNIDIENKVVVRFIKYKDLLFFNDKPFRDIHKIFWDFFFIRRYEWMFNSMV